MAPETRRLVKLVLKEEEDEKTQAVVDMLLAKGRAGDRKEWLMLTGDKAEVEV